MGNTAQRIQLILAGWDGQTPIAGTINTGSISQGIQIVADEMDKMRAERDENQRIIDQVWAERDEARAEVERLRPLAEEWEKWREFLMANESAKSSAGLLAYDWMEAARACEARK